MNIVYISNSCIPSRSANSIHVMKMCQAFAQNGHKVTLLAPDKQIDDYDYSVKDPFGYYGVENCFDIKKLFCLTVNRRSILYDVMIASALQKIKPHIVYGRFVAGCYYAALLGYPTIYEAHDPIWETNWHSQLIFKRMIKNKNFRKLIVISDALKKMFQSAISTYHLNIRVAHDGADESAEREALEDWPGRKDSLQIGYTGHLYKGRGTALILNLAQKIPDFDFHIIGGMEKDIQYWKSRSKFSNVFFHGHVSPRIIHKYRNSCDVLIAPYANKVGLTTGKFETSSFCSPLKIFEYMSSRKPIVASDLKVLREILNENNAILVPPDIMREWENALKSLKDKSLRDKLANQAYHNFVKKHRWTVRARDVLEGITDSQ